MSSATTNEVKLYHLRKESPWTLSAPRLSSVAVLSQKHCATIQHSASWLLLLGSCFIAFIQPQEQQSASDPSRGILRYNIVFVVALLVVLRPVMAASPSCTQQI